MFFPYNTDAPIYYRPIITIVMIAVNILVFICEVSDPDGVIVRDFSLTIGDGLHPIQWLTCNFLHAGIMHLIGNMLPFWTFGLLIEGKLGAIRTLLVYLGIGTLYGAAVQIIMLGGEPTICLGASAIVFGMMVIALIWAPENLVECVLIFSMRPFFFELRVKTLVGIFLAMEILILVWSGGMLSSSFLHVVGAIMGFVIGIWMLKSGQVDCENWDIFSVWAGRHTMTDIERIKHDANTPSAKQQKLDQIKKRKNMLIDEVRFAIDNNTPIPAFVITKKIIQEFPDDKIPEVELLLLIKILVNNKLWSESIEMMQEYLDNYTSKELPIRLNLARAFVLTNQPNSAENVLAKIIDPQNLAPEQQKVFLSIKKLAQEKAQSLSQQDTYGLAIN
ncbi:MAG: rhomboid family intramembrane serine protease [Planctomycetaceae bacterium]|nr:rhomboid family intramembrane serine protease [Planctomycetaceae bacterium]